MWQVIEHRDIEKVCRKLPPSILEKYEIWKEIIRVDGPEKLREYPGRA